MGESQGESQNESIGIAAVVVLVCHQRDFLLVIIGTGQTLHPLVTKHLDLLELACGMRSSLVSHGWCGQHSKWGGMPHLCGRKCEEAHHRWRYVLVVQAVAWFCCHTLSQQQCSWDQIGLDLLAVHTGGRCQKDAVLVSLGYSLSMPWTVTETVNSGESGLLVVHSVITWCSSDHRTCTTKYSCRKTPHLPCQDVFIAWKFKNRIIRKKIPELQLFPELRVNKYLIQTIFFPWRCTPHQKRMWTISHRTMQWLRNPCLNPDCLYWVQNMSVVSLYQHMDLSRCFAWRVVQLWAFWE